MEDRLRIEGVYSAMMTPYTEDGKIDENKLREFIQFFLKCEIDGVFPVSNVGEFAALSYEERCSIIKICSEENQGKLKLCPGVSDLNPDNILRLSDYCAVQGADAVILSTPYYYPYSAEYIRSYVMGVLEKSPLPVIFYHSPNFANQIPREQLMDILRHPKVVGMKESSGDVVCFLDIMNQIKSEQIEVDVMLGLEELMLTGLTNGARGCITSSSGIIPELLKKIYVCYDEGNMEDAVKYQEAVVRVSRLLNSYGFLPGYKMGMAARIPYRIFRGSMMDEVESKIQKEIPYIRDIIEKELESLKD